MPTDHHTAKDIAELLSERISFWGLSGKETPMAVVLLVTPVLQSLLHQLVGRMLFLHLVYESSTSTLVLKLI